MSYWWHDKTPLTRSGSLAVMAVCAMLAWPGQAPGAEDKKSESEQQESNKYDPFLGSATKAPWRGSQVIYSNTVSLIRLSVITQNIVGIPGLDNIS